VTRIVVTARAERDLEVIWLAIAADNTQAATRVVRTIATRIETLAMFPRVGPQRSDVRPDLRALVQRPYLVLYAIQPDSNDIAINVVEIVRIVDGRRELRRLF
jgi:toxin ParE1/3/4